MNTTTEATGLEPLPELTDDTIARMESDLFRGIWKERAAIAKKARRRRTTWITTGAAAAVIVVLAVVAPSVSRLVVQSSGGASVADSATAPLPARESGSAADSAALGAGTTASSGASPTTGRDIIATAQATVLVEDAATAARAIADAAAERGGYVESMTLSGSEVVAQGDAGASIDGGLVYDPSMPYPVGGDWITVRVPADELSSAIAELSEIGKVQASSISRQDVTDQTGDLRARIDAAQASVDRLTQLMAQAGSVADLIDAEQALSDRQATLESYQQQLASLESQVSLSSLTVSLTEPAEIVKPDPAGFGDGLATGWSGLLATLNGIVITLGFLLPWIGVAAIAALAVWGVRRLVRRSRAKRAPAD